MSLWDDVYTVDEFLCFELQEGCIVIAIVGLIYGLIGFSMVLSFGINYEEWRTLYDKRADELIYFISLFIMISEQVISSVMLIIGVLRFHEILLRYYLWSIFIHLCIDWLITLCMCGYCVCVHSCFRYNPSGTVVGLLAFACFYTFIWGYVIVAVNGYRMEL